MRDGELCTGLSATEAWGSEVCRLLSATEVWGSEDSMAYREPNNDFVAEIVLERKQGLLM